MLTIGDVMAHKQARAQVAVRPLYVIAREIRADWGKQGKGVNYAAKPYLEAMETLSKIEDNYYLDSGLSIVSYFLANAGTWRSEVAKRVKLELKKACNSYDQTKARDPYAKG